MNKILALLIGASFTLVACSSTTSPQNIQTPHATVVLSTCEDLQDFVASNHEQLKEAFANKDAYTIGALELQNRAVIEANLDCFPKIKNYLNDKQNSSSAM